MATDGRYLVFLGTGFDLILSFYRDFVSWKCFGCTFWAVMSE
jgi:hypothetical protein